MHYPSGEDELVYTTHMWIKRKREKDEIVDSDEGTEENEDASRQRKKVRHSKHPQDDVDVTTGDFCDNKTSQIKEIPLIPDLGPTQITEALLPKENSKSKKVKRTKKKKALFT